MKVSLMPMSEASSASKNLLLKTTQDSTPSDDLMSFISPVVASRRSVRRSDFKQN